MLGCCRETWKNHVVIGGELLIIGYTCQSIPCKNLNICSKIVLMNGLQTMTGEHLSSTIITNLLDKKADKVPKL